MYLYHPIYPISKGCPFFDIDWHDHHRSNHQCQICSWESCAGAHEVVHNIHQPSFPDNKASESNSIQCDSNFLLIWCVKNLFQRAQICLQLSFRHVMVSRAISSVSQGSVIHHTITGAHRHSMTWRIRPAGGTHITLRPHLLSFLDLPLLVKLFQMCLCHTPKKRPNKNRGWERSQVGKRFSLAEKTWGCCLGRSLLKSQNKDMNIAPANELPQRSRSKFGGHWIDIVVKTCCCLMATILLLFLLVANLLLAFKRIMSGMGTTQLSRAKEATHVEHVALICCFLTGCCWTKSF